MAQKNFFERKVRPAAIKAADFVTGIPTVGRSISDAVISKVYAPQIEAQNKRQDELDRQLLEQSKRQGTKLPTSYGKGKQTLEGSILGGRDLTTPEKAREGFTNLAGFASMGYAPGLKAATSGKFLLPKAAKAATKAIPVLSSKSPTVRLAANSALRGVENALPQAVVDVATKQDTNTILRNAGTNFALGAGGNALLSPKLLKGAYKESAPIIKSAVKNADNAVTNRQFYKPISSNAQKKVRSSGKFTTNKDLLERNIRLSTLLQAEKEGVDLATVVDQYGNYNPTNEPVVKVFVDPETNTLQRGISTSKEVQRYIDSRSKGNFLDKIDETKLGTDEDFNNEFFADRVAKQATTEELLNIERGIRGGKVAFRSQELDTPEAVARSLQNKLDGIEEFTYGSKTSEFKPVGSKGPGFISSKTRPIQEKVSQAVAKGLSSDSQFARTVARSIRGLFGSSGNTAEQTAELGKMRGGVDASVQLANDFYEKGTELVKKNPQSLERIHAVLDPELAKTKVSVKDLTNEELNALEVLQDASDFINDSNYAQGKISKEQWLKGKGGNYIARAYETYDYPPEIADFLTGKGKISTGQFKARKEVSDFMVEDAIRDPFYLMAKRLQQTNANKAIGDYGKYIIQDSDKVSDVARPGFTQISDSPSWGELKGKFVRQDVLEGIKGFYSDHKAIQGLYDVLNAYDRLPIRQFLKKTKTVYNPATRLGNQVSNRTFALLSGINPITFEKNVQTYAKKALQENAPLVRRMRSLGLLGTDASKKDLVQKLVDFGVNDSTGLQKVDDFITKTYSNSDDHAKIAAFKYFVDKGFSEEEAARKVRNSFQDYNTVGFMYDIGSKTPIFGNAFVRFQGDLLRILKNAAIENPLGLAGVAGGISLIGEFSSRWSGETPEDRKTRESRIGVPHIPYTNIPLVFQTPVGEVNAARLFGLYAITPAGEEQSALNDISRQLPIQVPTNKEDLLKSIGSDILAGPIISTLANTDFRGKSIRDPEENKFQETTLTPTEQNVNRAEYLARSYTPPVVNAATDLYKATQGQENFYGQVKTPKQALSGLTGVKIEEFGPAQAEQRRQKDAIYNQKKAEQNQSKIRQIEKQLYSGSITKEQADKRIAQLGGNVSQPTQQSGEIAQSVADGKYYFINSKGERDSYDTKRKAEIGKAKDDVRSGKVEKASVGDFEYTLDENGEVQSRNKVTYRMDLLKEQANAAKEVDNYADYEKYTIQRAALVYSQLNKVDQDSDPVKYLKLKGELDDIVRSVAKYRSYGNSFKKPKKAKKVKKPKKIPVRGNSGIRKIKGL